MGVALYARLTKRRWLTLADGELALSRAGLGKMESLGVDVGRLRMQKRRLCRACLDWSVRRHHLAGSLGDALLARMMELGWARREGKTRVVLFNVRGERALADWLE